MLIPPDSSLLRIPANLKNNQRLFIDGIRYSVQMFEVAYNRISSTLTTLHGEDEASTPYAFAHIFLDAWSMVDNINRIRELIDHMPGMSKGPIIKTFLRTTKDFNKLRNAHQHLKGEYATDNSSLAPWGTVTWIEVSNEDLMNNRIKSHILIAGANVTAEYIVINPLGKRIKLPVDCISLSGFGFSVSLSDAFLSVERLTHGVEASWKQAIEQYSKDCLGSDTHLYATIAMET
jgi:hypothetical protein